MATAIRDTSFGERAPDHEARNQRDDNPRSDSAHGAPPAARAVDLVKTYGKGDAVVRALDGVTLEFGRGRFTAVMGPPGRESRP